MLIQFSAGLLNILKTQQQKHEKEINTCEIFGIHLKQDKKNSEKYGSLKNGKIV